MQVTINENNQGQKTPHLSQALLSCSCQCLVPQRCNSESTRMNLESLGHRVGIAGVRLSSKPSVCSYLHIEYFPSLEINSALQHCTCTSCVTGLPLLCFSSSCIISHIPGKIILRSKSQGRNQKSEISSLQSASVPSSSMSTDSLFRTGVFASPNCWKYQREAKQLCNNQYCSETQ